MSQKDLAINWSESAMKSQIDKTLKEASVDTIGIDELHAKT